MITKDDVIHFYTKYKENLKKEERVTAELMQAGNQEKWVEKLKQKFRIMRQLYIENETMLNMYVRPFVEERAELTEKVAKPFYMWNRYSCVNLSVRLWMCADQTVWLQIRNL